MLLWWSAHAEIATYAVCMHGMLHDTAPVLLHMWPLALESACTTSASSNNSSKQLVSRQALSPSSPAPRSKQTYLELTLSPQCVSLLAASGTTGSALVAPERRVPPVCFGLCTAVVKHACPVLIWSQLISCVMTQSAACKEQAAC